MGLKEASSIKAIDKTSVHRICSGQVVLTLATAVKELVENSIDAGATTVEVKLKDYGSESIEVIDNGFGVEEKNFEGLTLKHHTSKLEEFDDLTNVSTFGFRGEALSSLCALSNMTIVTRHKSNSIATRLEFNQDGIITTKKCVPRQIGTTVQIVNIFHTLPVRHKEFQKNVKREFAKLIQVLNAYCIVNTGVRISCSNITGKGSRSTVVSTNGNDSMKENIANVFSPKQLQSLMKFKQVDAGDDVCEDFGIKPQQKSAVKFRIEGFVSKCEHGQGRSSSDRQFIFINKRPCDSVKIVKIVNEVYHTYNRHQNPFIAINISMDKESVDVNVTPDKRQIFVEGERLLLAILKTSLIKMYEPTTSVYRVNNILPVSQFSSPSLNHESQIENDQRQSSLHSCLSRDSDSVFSDSSPSLCHTLSSLKRSFSSAFAKHDPTSSLSKSPLQKRPDLASPRRSETFPPASRSNFITQFFSYHKQAEHKPSTSVLGCSSQPHSCEEVFVENDSVANNDGLDTSSHTSNFDANQHPHVIKTAGECVAGGRYDTNEFQDLKLQSKSEIAQSECEVNFTASASSSIKVSDSCSAREEIKKQRHTDNDDTQQCPDFTLLAPPCQIEITDDDVVEQQKHEKAITFSFESLRKRLHSQKERDMSAPSTFCRAFRAKICPTDNKSAEDELQKEISKDMFKKMEILGQFNLGFIITKLGSDLFIVDQHATDEKYNFEMLQRHTVLQSQRLIAPQCMELTASNETILVDNLDVFKKNGFDFKIEPEAPPTQRVKLVSAPASKNWTFGKDDIEEMVFMLTDSPNVMCRPTRIRMMFASRSCRKSVMIGTPLNKSEMRKLVCHMGEIEQPWNCPHGRPTMRHLFNLDMLPSAS